MCHMCKIVFMYNRYNDVGYNLGYDSAFSNHDTGMYCAHAIE